MSSEVPVERSPHRRHWRLDPSVAFLNHGSFGATPAIVLEFQRQLQDALEFEPIEFLAIQRTLEPKLDAVRELVAVTVEADPQDIGWVRNATDGVNAVVRSFPFQTGDEVLVTNHGYNACSNAARYAAERAGAILRVANIPFPLESSQQVIEAIGNEISERTRLLIVDHITSPTGIVMPLESIVRFVRSCAVQADGGIRILVDGAHAPGQVSLQINEMGVDYYTANHHKWLCAPKASGFLWVRRALQPEVRPTVISHASNWPRPGRSQFIAEFDWVGTYDPTPLLALKASLSFLNDLLPGGLNQLMQANRDLALQSRRLLCEALELQPPTPVEMIASLVALPLPSRFVEDGPSDLGKRLFVHHKIEVPVFVGPQGQPLIRTSCQAYNDVSEYQRLAAALTGSA